MGKSFFRVVIYLSIFSLYGCLISVPNAPPEHMNQRGEFKRLIGQNSESIVRMLGYPAEILTDGSMQYLMYLSTSRGVDITFFTIIPIYVETGQLNNQHCLRFTIDSDNVVKSYKIKTRGIGTDYGGPTGTLLCRFAFWSREQQRKLKHAADLQKRVDNVIEQQLDNVIEQQRAVREQQQSEYEKNILSWLCEAADQGDPEAIFRIARFFEYGNDRWDNRTANVTIQPDFLQAYVWYSLLVEKSDWYDQQSLNAFVERRLDEQDLENAKKARKDWGPGQCEKNIAISDDAK